MVIKTKNESKAGRIKNLALEKMDIDLPITKSEIYYKDPESWFFELSASYEATNIQDVVYALLTQTTKTFELFEVRGPIMSDKGSFAAFLFIILKIKMDLKYITA